MATCDSKQQQVKFLLLLHFAERWGKNTVKDVEFKKKNKTKQYILTQNNPKVFLSGARSNRADSLWRQIFNSNT